MKQGHPFRPAFATKQGVQGWGPKTIGCSNGMKLIGGCWLFCQPQDIFERTSTVLETSDTWSAEVSYVRKQGSNDTFQKYENKFLSRILLDVSRNGGEMVYLKRWILRVSRNACQHSKDTMVPPMVSTGCNATNIHVAARQACCGSTWRMGGVMKGT